jgi:hypothetical protein
MFRPTTMFEHLLAWLESLQHGMVGQALSRGIARKALRIRSCFCECALAQACGGDSSRYRIDSICWAIFAIFFFYANQPRRCDPASTEDSRTGARVPKGQLKTRLRFH